MIGHYYSQLTNDKNILNLLLGSAQDITLYFEEFSLCEHVILRKILDIFRNIEDYLDEQNFKNNLDENDWNSFIDGKEYLNFKYDFFEKKKYSIDFYIHLMDKRDTLKICEQKKLEELMEVNEEEFEKEYKMILSEKVDIIMKTENKQIEFYKLGLNLLASSEIKYLIDNAMVFENYFTNSANLTISEIKDIHKKKEIQYLFC